MVKLRPDRNITYLLATKVISDKFPKHGKIEYRAALPDNPLVFYVFNLMPIPIELRNDSLESLFERQSVGRETGIFIVNCGFYNTYMNVHGQLENNSFDNYSVEWNETNISYSVNGVEVTTKHGYDQDYLGGEYEVRLFFGVWRPVFQQYYLEALGMSIVTRCQDFVLIFKI